MVSRKEQRMENTKGVKMKGKRNVRTKHLLHDGTVSRDVTAVLADTGRLYRISRLKAMAEAQQRQDDRNAE